MNISSSVGNASSVFWSSLPSVNWRPGGLRVSRGSVSAQGKAGVKAPARSAVLPASATSKQVLTVGAMVTDILMLLAWAGSIPLMLWLGAIAGLA